VRSHGPLRGPLDYQHGYSVESGMGPDATERQYHRFVGVISKEFRGHARMPENKTHCLLLKSFYEEAGTEGEIFADEIIPEELGDFELTLAQGVTLRDGSDGSWLMQNQPTGAELRIGNRLAKLVQEVENTGCLRIDQRTSHAEAEHVAKFFTYLRRQGYVRVGRQAEKESGALLRV